MHQIIWCFMTKRILVAFLFCFYLIFTEVIHIMRMGQIGLPPTLLPLQKILNILYMHFRGWLELFLKMVFGELWVTRVCALIVKTLRKVTNMWSQTCEILTLKSTNCETYKFVLFCNISKTDAFIFFIFDIYIVYDSIHILLNLFDLDMMTFTQNCDQE